MKKVFLSLAMVALLLCGACGGPAEAAVTVDGTWYSVTDTTMYNFADGEIKAAGVTVGQYEDNGDSVVISMMADGANLQLYVTTMDDMNVLADVREGEGNIYFCKGLENAQAIMEDAILGEFKSYLDENLLGLWEVVDAPSGDYTNYLRFISTMHVQITTFEIVVSDYICDNIEYGLADGRPYAEFSVHPESDPNSVYQFRFSPADDFSVSGGVLMDGERLLHKVR